MSNQLNFEYLSTQYAAVNDEIEEAENDIRAISVGNFVLNPEVTRLVQEIKSLHSRRDAILQEMKKLKENKADD